MSPINPLQKRVLLVLAENNMVTSAEIAETMPTTKQTARNQLRSLTDKGYAERVPVQEVKLVLPAYTRITEKGRAALTFDFKAQPKERVQQSSAPQREPVHYVPYIPPPMQSVRPGADDHLQFKSRGF